MIILKISDAVFNGKGSNYSIYSNYHFMLYNIQITEEQFFHNNQQINLNNVNVVFFDYNEDLLQYQYGWDMNLLNKYSKTQDMINAFKAIHLFIKIKYPNIKIYHDPFKCFYLGNKITVYQHINDIESNIFKLPKWNNIKNISDIMKISYFPCIIKTACDSHASSDALCKNKNELVNAYSKFKNKENILCSEFINCYIDELKCYCCVRLIVFNDKIIDFFFRPSNKWNIHTGDQTPNKILEANEYFKKYYEKNQEEINIYAKKIHSLYGNGVFSYDCILNNDKLYICEIGIKCWDDTMINFLHKHNIKMNKLHEDINKYRKFIVNNL